MKDRGNMIFAIFAIIGLILCIITYFIVPAPAPVWLFVATGASWFISGLAKTIVDPSPIIVLSILNAIMAYVIYAIQYGVI